MNKSFSGKFPLPFLFITLFALSLSAQETHLLSLNDCISIAQKRSYKIRYLKEDYKISRANLNAATNRFNLQVNMNFSLPDYGETISSFQDTSGKTLYFPSRQAIYSGDLTIAMPLPTDGRLYLRSGIFHIQDLSNKINSFRLNSRIGFEQPLEAFYSYNNILGSLKQARLNFDLTNRRLIRTLLDLNYEASSAYYSYLSTIESEKIAGQTLLRQKDANTLAQNKFKAGVIAEGEALQMDVDLADAQNNYDIARARTASEGNALKQLLDFPLADSIALKSNLDYDVVDVPLQTALEYGLKNRFEIREREISRKQAEINIERTEVNGQVTGSISGYYDFIGVYEADRSIPLYTNFQSAWDELRRRPGNRGIALTVHIPLWDWGVNNALVQAAKARYYQAVMGIDEEKVSVERDIRNTVNNIHSSLKRLKFLERNINIAERSFEISKRRFANGEINSQSLALDRNRLSQAYQSRLSALVNYKLLLEDIIRKTFYDFKNKREIGADNSADAFLMEN